MIHNVRQTWHRLGVLLVVLLVVTGSIPALALAQATGDDQTDQTRAGGIVRIGPGQTVSGDLDATGGTVLVLGTVDGDLEAVGGTVVVSGTVTGDVQAIAGSVTIEGDVDGSVDALGGSVLVRDGARIGGSLEAAAGAIQLDGEVVGNARLGGDEVTLGPTAVVGGNLEYDAETFDVAPGASVAGTTTRNDDLSFNVGSPFAGGVDFAVPTIPPVVVVAYGFLANLLLGAVLLLAAPRFAEQVVDVGTNRALQSGGVGLLTLVGVPVVLVILLLTIVGIPLSLLGFVVFAFALWVGQVFGAYLVGTKALDLADRSSRWGALLLGLLALAALELLPFGLGGVVSFVVLLLGLGALALALYERSRGERRRTTGVAADDSEGRPTA
ncbi:protein CcmA, bactofilin family [Halogranum amylolyticum]|uniref:Protein CcmA, bactofilin family n=1 Tax=Halogranum amylolyticum TaxID=660520 RepID=A0A1H8U5M8_9EURY|nr:polymer-forming cytoskeletal protein [Halogranum amylolyticum]SEO98144.1 protein CcmA, bactofilin family [Halogranum amylolyticum]